MSEEEEDWFERALQESGESEKSGEAEDADVAESENEVAEDPDELDAEEGPDQLDTEEVADEFDGGDVGDGRDEEGEFGEDDPFGGDAGFDQSETSTGATGTPSGEGASADPFGEDFATALQNAPDPDAGGGAGAGMGGGGTDAGFGEMGGGGMGGAEMGGGDDFGFGDFGGGGGGASDSFDDEELDSDIERLKIGIDGLDEMILGGVPKRSLMVAVGSAGTGKTTFGMQFLHEALDNGDSVVYISLEEGRERILSTADEKGWSFSEYEDADQLAIVDFDPIEMAHSLSSIQNELPRLIEDFGADRLVLDSVSLLEMMYDSASKRRSEVFGFTKSLKAAGVTTFVTSEASAENPYQSKYGIIEYLADAVFVLQYVRPSDFRETRLAVEIQKIRDANHSRETKPYEITGEGISVYRQANIF